MTGQLRDVEALRDPGCEAFEFNRGVADGGKFVLFERYRDGAANTAHRASVAFQKFPHICGVLGRELLKQSHTSNSMFLVSLLNPKFANKLAAHWVRTSGSGH